MTTRKMIVHAGQVVCSHDAETLRDGAVVVHGNTIEAIGSFEALSKRYPEAERLGGERFLLIPGLINGHGHGRGLSDFQRGALDNTLETWLLETRKYLPVAVYDDLAYCAVRLLKCGVTTCMHNHLLQNPAQYEEEFDDALRAYRDTGIRVQFNPAVRDQNPFVYGDNQAFLAGLPEELRRVLTAPPPPGALTATHFVPAVSALFQAHNSEMCRIGFGPLAPQWCSDNLLKEIHAASQQLDVPIHIHAMQSICQKVHGLSVYGKSLIQHMNAIGVLGPRVVIGHCVWPSAEDIALLAKTGTGVTHHPSCNLRVRNGIAPVAEMLRAGVRVGLGLDGKSINDDDDMLQEMKVAFLLQRLCSLEAQSPYPTARQIFKMATATNSELLGYAARLGRLAPGALADMVLLDYQAICYPFVDPAHDPIDTLLYRATGRHVHTVMVDGKVVVQHGKLVSVDEEQIAARLAEAASQPRSEQQRNGAHAMDRLKEHVRQYYAGWPQRVEARPYFHVNSQVDGLK